MTSAARLACMAMQDLPTEPASLGEAERVVPLTTEEFTVTRRQVSTGTVAVTVQTRTRNETVDEDVVEQHVEIERVQVGRQIYAMPETREENGITIIPVVEEIVVVERRLILKEEIRLHRVQTVKKHNETVELHEQFALVERRKANNDTLSVDPADQVHNDHQGAIL